MLFFPSLFYLLQPQTFFFVLQTVCNRHLKKSGLNKNLLFNALRPGGIQGRAGRVQKPDYFSPQLSSLQFSCFIMSDSLQPHGLQHTRLPSLSPTPGSCSNSYPSSRWCHPTISSSVHSLLLPSVFPSIRVFSNESVLHIRWPKYWSFSFSISPSNEYSGLISFRMDWLDPLVVQGTLKGLLQHHSSKASMLRRSAFFMLQFSHPYVTTRKTIAIQLYGPCWYSNISAFYYAIFSIYSFSFCYKMAIAPSGISLCSTWEKKEEGHAKHTLAKGVCPFLPGKQ